MKPKKEKLDLLIEKNTQQQLSVIDWDKFSQSLSKRLKDDTQSKQRNTTIFFKIAAALAAAAVIVIGITLRLDKSSQPIKRKVEVKLMDKKNPANVNIITQDSIERTKNNISLLKPEIAKCQVRIIDTAQQQRENGKAVVWIIVRKNEDVYAYNGADRDLQDLICMF